MLENESNYFCRNSGSRVQHTCGFCQKMFDENEFIPHLNTHNQKNIPTSEPRPEMENPHTSIVKNEHSSGESG